MKKYLIDLVLADIHLIEGDIVSQKMLVSDLEESGSESAITRAYLIKLQTRLKKIKRYLERLQGNHELDND